MAKILIVDDSPVEIKIIRKLLGDEYEILEAVNGKEAVEVAGKRMPDLILMDIIMPEMDGIMACKLLKSQPLTAGIPVVFITAVSNSQDIVKGFEAGGQDYITKPFYSPELCARLKVHLDLKLSREAIAQYAVQLEAKNQNLNDLMKKLETAAMTDFVTGLPNRRRMMEFIKAKTNSIKQKGKTTLVLADIDHFKTVNDTFGHDCGDVVLKEVADLMGSVVQEDDIVARWGGEEFLIMLPGVDLSGGRVIAERMRQVIERTVFRYNERPFSLTVTLGVAYLDQELGFDASIKKADEALYKGKLTRNCVVSQAE